MLAGAVAHHGKVHEITAVVLLQRDVEPLHRIFAKGRDLVLVAWRASHFRRGVGAEVHAHCRTSTDIAAVNMERSIARPCSSPSAVCGCTYSLNRSPYLPATQASPAA